MIMRNVKAVRDELFKLGYVRRGMEGKTN